MKKYIFAISTIAALLLSGVGSATPAKASSLLFGQQQAYSAIVREDGTVITYAKMYLNNQSDADMKQASFKAPKDVALNDLEAFQILVPERCANNMPTTKDDYSTGSYYSSCAEVKKQAYEFNKYSYYSRDEDALRYKKMDVSTNGDQYTITLPEPVKKNEQGAYLLAYRTKDYTSNSFGIIHLKFKTLRSASAINNVQVSIDVANDLYTKSGKAKISDSSYTAKDSIAMGANASNAVTDSNLDKIQSNIGQGGSFTKEGKSLSPDESLEVTGELADAPWKLALGWIVTSIVAIIAVIALIVFLLRKANNVAEPREKKE